MHLRYNLSEPAVKSLVFFIFTVSIAQYRTYSQVISSDYTTYIFFFLCIWCHVTDTFFSTNIWYFYRFSVRATFKHMCTQKTKTEICFSIYWKMLSLTTFSLVRNIYRYFYSVIKCDLLCKSQRLFYKKILMSTIFINAISNICILIILIRF